MKKIFDYRLVWFCATIGTVSLLSSAVKAQFVPASSANQQYAPYAHPVAMQNVGTQQYIGGQTVLQGVQRDSVTGNVTPTVQVAPTINSVYATPMRRVNEIPLYGKNKNLYFYAEKKPDESVFHDSGLYVFAAYSTGKNKNGINAEKSIYDDADNWFGGSDANSDMGTANGLTLGVGRQMSDSLGVEFMYSRYTGMKYGDYVHFSEEEDTGEDLTDDLPGFSDEDVVPEEISAAEDTSDPEETAQTDTAMGEIQDMPEGTPEEPVYDILSYISSIDSLENLVGQLEMYPSEPRMLADYQDVKAYDRDSLHIEFSYEGSRMYISNDGETLPNIVNVTAGSSLLGEDYNSLSVILEAQGWVPVASEIDPADSIISASYNQNLNGMNLVFTIYFKEDNKINRWTIDNLQR